MNNCISKIHFTNSTGVSLNDRFTAMSKIGGPMLGVAPPTSRIRSNSLTRMDSNRQLVEHWDRSNAMQSAMQLKNTAIRRPTRQRIQRNNIVQQIKRTNRLGGGMQLLQRTNSLCNIATMTADRLQLQRTRGVTPSVTSRLGNAAQIRRGRSISRGRSVSRARSASRNRSSSRGRQPSLSRTNSQQDLRRGRSRDRISRAGSVTNLSRAGSRNRLSATLRKAVAPNDARRRLLRKTALAVKGTINNGGVTRGRSRSRSRSRARSGPSVATNNNNANAGGGRARSRNRANSRGRNTRSASVNSRLGTNRTNETATSAVAGTRGGRVAKRSGSRRRRGVKNAAAAIGTRVGRALKR